MDKEIRAYVCRMQYYSAIKVETSPFVTTWIDFEGIMLSKMSDNERQTPYNLTHMWNIKRRRKKNNQKQNSQIQRTDWLLPGAGVGGVGEMSTVVKMYKFPGIK